ncbi:MAG: protein kinase [Verrucomicrobia subdivision 3 bacterium]|nr:protein kinase [Limisphaerales bacterium]
MGTNPETPPPEIPEHELLRRIGAGSYGEVWLARSVTGAHRAVKIIRRDRFESEVPFEREFDGVRQFEEISRGQSGLVDLFLVGRNEAVGFFYYVMELAAPESEGEGAGDWEAYAPRTLQSDLRAHGRLPVDDCLDLGITVAEALQHLHAHGLVHRDVKPSNLIFTRGRYCLADIGMVTAASDGEAFVGTHGYLPREGAGQPSADIFGLGRVLYEALTGEDRQSFPALPKSMRSEKSTAAQRELNKVILKTCAHTPEERYLNAVALAADLARIADGGHAEAVREHSRLLWPMAAAVALGALVLGWAFWPASVKDSDLLIHWRFDGDLADASGNHNDALGQWTRATADRFDQPHRAIAMGADASLRASHDWVWSSDQPRTVALWFRVDEWAACEAGWFEERASGTGAPLLSGAGFSVRMTGNGLIGLDGNYICALFDVGKIETQCWHFLAITCEGKSGTSRVWFDGEKFEPLDVKNENRFWWKPEKPFRTVKTPLEILGFQGAVDEVRMYQRALTEKEIKEIHDTEQPLQPTVAGEAWSESFSWAALLPSESEHLNLSKNLRRVEEAGGAVYWSPQTNGQPAEVRYQFKFERPILRAHLRLPIYCVDLTPARDTPMRGSFATEVSADGKDWHSLYNGLEPQPQWGEGTGAGALVAECPKAALGQTTLWLRVRLRAEGGTSNLSGAQLGRAPSDAKVDWKTKSLLRVKLQSP